MTRILGLDVGERRIGVAVSTPEGTLAVPLRVIDRAGESDVFRTIASLAEDGASFETLRAVYYAAADRAAPPLRAPPERAAPPRLSEPWFC